MFGSVFIDDRLSVEGREVSIEGLERPAVVTDNGMVLFGRDGKKVMVTQLQFEDGRMIPARQWGREEKTEKLVLSPDEEKLQEKMMVGAFPWSLVAPVISLPLCMCVRMCVFVCVCRPSGEGFSAPVTLMSKQISSSLVQVPWMSPGEYPACHIY